MHPVQRIVVDSGYESEENYNYVDGSEQLSLFVKPSDHEQKKKRKYKNDIGRRENMAYDVEKDEYTCAQGKKLQAVGVKKQKSDTGYVQEMTVYECTDCKGCPSGFVYCFLGIISRFFLGMCQKDGLPRTILKNRFETAPRLWVGVFTSISLTVPSDTDIL